jgi:hypothetical protein
VEYGDYEEQLAYAEMYTPDILDTNGKPIQGRSSLTAEWANLLRAKGRPGYDINK